MSADADWLAALTDPANTCAVVIAGHTRARSHWALRARRVDEHWLCALGDGVALWGEPPHERLLAPGAAWWCTPGIEHSLRSADPRQPIRLYHWRFRLHRDGRELSPTPGTRLLPDAAGLLPLFAAARAEWLAELPLRTQRVRLLLAAIAAELLRAGAVARRGTAFTARQRLAALAYLDRQPHPDAAGLARAVGLSHDYATRRFRATFGAAPRAYVVRRRVERLAEALCDGPQPVALLAAQSGFPDVQTAIRQFRTVYGATPAQWRRLHRG